MEAVDILAKCRLFASLDATALEQLSELCEPVAAAGGRPLFAAGEPPSYLYIVASGRLRAMRPDGKIAGDIGMFEPIGEISIITGEPRSGEVFAMRDSLLLRIARDELLEFVRQHPSALLEMSRVLIGRLRQDQRPAALARAREGQTLALLPADTDVPIGRVTRNLAAALPHEPRVIDEATVDATLGAGASATPFEHGFANTILLGWLAEQERAGERLIYLSHQPSGPWAERCLRQADRVVMIAGPSRAPATSPALALVKRLKMRAPVDLAIVLAGPCPSSLASRWRTAPEIGAHHFLQLDSEPDHRRLARQLSGQGLGLVLGGGGARGFAHIGLIRAMEEAKIKVDLVGGSSMGAFFAGLLASGADSRELRHVARDTFVDHHYLNDYVLPRVSLIRGRRFMARLVEIFGDRMIEDLPLPYFCVSTNLTRGVAVTHDRGPMATWIGTSMAVPGFAPPMVWHGELLADGAILNSLPTDVMLALGRGPVIASDVSVEGGVEVPGVEGPDPEALLRRNRDGEPVTLTDILFRSATLTSETGVRARAAAADLYLRMPVSKIGLFDWKRVDEIIERGYRHAVTSLETWQTKPAGKIG